MAGIERQRKALPSIDDLAAYIHDDFRYGFRQADLEVALCDHHTTIKVMFRGEMATATNRTPGNRLQIHINGGPVSDISPDEIVGLTHQTLQLMGQSHVDTSNFEKYPVSDAKHQEPVAQASNKIAAKVWANVSHFSLTASKEVYTLVDSRKGSFEKPVKAADLINQTGKNKVTIRTLIHGGTFPVVITNTESTDGHFSIANAPNSPQLDPSSILMLTAQTIQALKECGINVLVLEVVGKKAS